MFGAFGEGREVSGGEVEAEADGAAVAGEGAGEEELVVAEPTIGDLDAGIGGAELSALLGGGVGEVGGVGAGEVPGPGLLPARR